METKPDARGRFGAFGGRFVPETLMPALEQLDAEFERAWQDAAFRTEFNDLLREYVGRPNPLTEAKRLF